jgi:hypothetical protein
LTDIDSSSVPHSFSWVPRTLFSHLNPVGSWPLYPQFPCLTYIHVLRWVAVLPSIPLVPVSDLHTHSEPCMPRTHFPASHFATQFTYCTSASTKRILSHALCPITRKASPTIQKLNCLVVQPVQPLLAHE